MDLVELLASPDRRERQAAVEALSGRSDPGLIHALVDLVLRRQDDLGAFNAALQVLAGAGPGAVDELCGLLLRAASHATPEGDVRTQVRIHTAQLLGRLADRRAVPALIAVLDDTEENVRFHAVEALGELGAPEASGPLAALLGRDTRSVQYAAILALARLGSPVAPGALEALLKDPYLAEAAITALGSLGGPFAAASVLAWLRTPQGVPELAYEALAGILRRFPQARLPAPGAEALQKLLDEAGQIACADEPDPEDMGAQQGSLCLNAALVLGSFYLQDPGNPALRHALVQLLAREPARLQAENALSAVTGYGASPDLIAMLDHPDSMVALSAARILAALRDPAALAGLVDALDAEDPALASQAALALGEIASSQAGEALFARLASPRPGLRSAATQALARWTTARGPEAGAARLEALRTDPNPLLREAGVRLLATTHHPDAAATAWAALRDADPAVRRAAVEVLPLTGHPAALAGLQTALQTTTDAALRGAAAQALASLPANQAAPALHQALADPDGWVRRHACRSLSQLRLPASLPHLLPLLEDPLPPVQIAAILAIGTIAASENEASPAAGPETHDAVRERLNALLSHADANVRAAAAWAIAALPALTRPPFGPPGPG